MTFLDTLRRSEETLFSIAQVIPGTVIGPSEFATTAAQALAYVDRQTKALLFDDMKPRYAFGFVNVQDCARVHIEALDEGKVRREDVPPWYVAAGGSEEELLLDGEMVWKKAGDMVEREYVEEVERGVFKVGRSKTPINMPYRVDSRRTEEMLLGGEKIRGFEECVREVARWYVGLKGKEEGAV
jgi:nucleoside-diphosphate-sugar epimerase